MDLREIVASETVLDTALSPHPVMSLGLSLSERCGASKG